MRKPINLSLLDTFMRSLASRVRSPSRIYLVGGSSAVLLGWRDSTIDVDLKFIPESDELLRSLPALKEQLNINLEIASPDHFIPELPGWQERSLFIRQEGTLAFLHYDFYAQALAKIERGHAIDQQDVNEMIRRDLVERQQLLELFTAIESEFYRYPALDGPSFRKAVEQIAQSTG